jgi:hypothetical protein
MDFSDALLMLRSGRRVARSGWNAPFQFVHLAEPGNLVIGANGQQAVLRPFLMLHTAQDEWVPWTVSQSDVLGDDWGVTE